VSGRAAAFLSGAGRIAAGRAGGHFDGALVASPADEEVGYPCGACHTPDPCRHLRLFLQGRDVVTGPFGYVRLLGDREAVDATPTLDHVVLDRGAQVAEDAEAIRWLRGRVPVLALVNNHFSGFAPETARQLAALAG
jgi:hypothetical protein